ncbi:NUDIX domain-containing protein [Sediminibacterium ginsengisoli]|uniref:ADP-ribose pyrophosphatase YjhB, NUDIX family n=1 Tax=Sediminibacterium ginsengisoli TaxID=413434 RepID=A0A1T4LEA4_9BACT|nr:NUDIX domain-containing protein [Sediminibacterium ginsengisoli]SJZ52951.1 ADP-ribose pyrophosphatase YjhB, NUDIX family [Sediminibacterium ginsengisoli]
MACFNVRVYGVLLNSERQLLVSDELIKGNSYTKLPGGGLEPGEGTRDCLKREFMEETGLNIEVGNHLYTTDFYQVSAFNHRDQIISIYYYVHVAEPMNLPAATTPFAFTPGQVSNPDEESLLFRWIPWQEIREEVMTLPIDKVVMRMLKNETGR